MGGAEAGVKATTTTTKKKRKKKRKLYILPVFLKRRLRLEFGRS